MGRLKKKILRMMIRGEFKVWYHQTFFIPGAGHEIWWEKPDIFVTEIAKFLEGVR